MDRNIFFVKKGSYICGLLHMLNETKFENKVSFNYYRSDFNFTNELEDYFDSSDVEENRIIIVRVTDNVSKELNEINDILFQKSRISERNLVNFEMNQDGIGVFLFDEIEFYNNLNSQLCYEYEDDIVTLVDHIHQTEPESIKQKRNTINMKLTCFNKDQDLNTTQVYTVLREIFKHGDFIEELNEIYGKVHQFSEGLSG